MQGCANDFIVIDELDGPIYSIQERSSLARILCHRRFSVGANDVIFLIHNGNDANAHMRIFEPDGSEADMCGNATRCVAHYLRTVRNMESPIRLSTRSGIKTIQYLGKVFGEDWYKVDMGVFKFKAEDVPLQGDQIDSEQCFLGKELYFDALRDTVYTEDENGKRKEGCIKLYILNDGEPHAVIFYDDLKFKTPYREGFWNFNAEEIGNIICHEDYFPVDINVNFVNIKAVKGSGYGEIEVRTYERGVNEVTYACGTGSTACGLISQMFKDVSNPTKVVTTATLYRPREWLQIEVVKEETDYRAFMSGPAIFVIKGELDWSWEPVV